MGCVGSCLGSCLATAGCQCVNSACGGCKSKQGSLWPYMILFLFSTMISIIFRFWAEPVYVNLYIYHLGFCTSNLCLGVGGVNRMTFAMFVFFFIHAVLLKFIPSCSRLDSQNWWAKLLLFGILLVCAWLIPNNFYGVYMHFARIISAGFLLLQLILLIDFAYRWNESWTSDDKPWGQKAVLAACVLIYACCITFFALDLVYFTDGEDGCHLQKFFIAFTLCLTFVMTGLSVSGWVGEGGGLLPAAVVTIYSYWLLFQALTSDPSSCNTVSNRSRQFAPLIIGLILTSLSVTWASYRVATNQHAFGEGQEQLNGGAGSSSPKPSKVSNDADGGDVEAAVAAPVASDHEEDDEDDDTESPDSEEKAHIHARFHVLMACASMYVCMLLSAWGSQETLEGGISYDLNEANVWIKIASQWICILLYVWTLIAPKVCEGRDFN